MPRISHEEMVSVLTVQEARWRFQVWYMSLVIRLLVLMSGKLSALLCSSWVHKTEEPIHQSALDFVKTIDEIVESWNEKQ